MRAITGSLLDSNRDGIISVIRCEIDHPCLNVKNDVFSRLIANEAQVSCSVYSEPVPFFECGLRDNSPICRVGRLESCVRGVQEHIKGSWPTTIFSSEVRVKISLRGVPLCVCSFTIYNNHWIAPSCYGINRSSIARVGNCNVEGDSIWVLIHRESARHIVVISNG
jgi:hypothetical protein